jgi:hypothetical protein
MSQHEGTGIVVHRPLLRLAVQKKSQGTASSRLVPDKYRRSVFGAASVGIAGGKARPGAADPKTNSNAAAITDDQVERSINDTRHFPS